LFIDLFPFGKFFDAIQLMLPEAFERLRPFMHRFDRLRVRTVKLVPSVAPNVYQSHIPQNLQML
jgi:hypothetical protein